MLIDFKEILDSTDWEEFSKAFLSLMGYKIDLRPGIGSDGGKDIIASRLVGHNGLYRWLVSCKYKSSGSLGVADDEANANKLFEYKCHGFLFVYSRPITQGLLDSIERVCDRAVARHHVFTNREIEQILVSDPCFYILIRQFFPRSYERLVGDFGDSECDCGRSQGSVFLLPYTDPGSRQVTHVRCCGSCYSYVMSSLEEANIHYGEPVVIHDEEYD